ncbi:hypothetical protein EJ04DRAFT_564924 [Polyplosphaeria fusca]|uniref:Calcium-dependent phosphotriesterase n=1 Tax=Polyplosphaeria fusca TaxID=682080 RepID=A0A9P4QYR3_9PLEO|nr:hypothetical protein EJ04DRAFT_564924 [Polyplosphaeria fusca]
MAVVRYLPLFVVLAGVWYQWWLKDFIFQTLGVWKVVEPIEKFPYKCRSIKHKQLEACGDMWLDEKNRVLYAACVGLKAREQWNPRQAYPKFMPRRELIESSAAKFNLTSRPPEGSNLMAIYIDQPRKDGTFKMHRISAVDLNEDPEPGDGHFDLSGFDVQPWDDKTIRFWLLNQRPPYSPNGTLLSPTKYGSNTTIDVYEYTLGSKTMSFVASGKHASLHTPNKLTFIGSNNFVATNERSSKLGWLRPLDALRSSGSLVYHDDFWDSYVTTRGVAPVPGHIVRGHDDRVYVPSQVDNKIRVFELQERGGFRRVEVFSMPMPIVGLTLDGAGGMWGVGRSRYDPTGTRSTGAVFKVERREGGRGRYEIKKVLEDGEGGLLRGASVVRFDGRNRRLYLGGTHMPFLAVCERKR